MIRIGDGNFIQNEPYMDTVVAIRIEKGEYYFLGWMEEAENYNIQIAKHPENCLLLAGHPVRNNDGRGR